MLDAALLQVSQVARLESPRNHDLAFLQDWLKRPTMGNSFLQGREASTWQGRQVKEMVSLMPSKIEADPFSTWLSTGAVNVFDKLWGNRRKSKIPLDPDSGIVEYDDRRLNKISHSVGVTFASLVPTLCVLVLYFVKRPIIRLGLLIVFTAVFSASLSTFTNARKIEIFSAVAAYVSSRSLTLGFRAADNRKGSRPSRSSSSAQVIHEVRCSVAFQIRYLLLPEMEKRVFAVWRLHDTNLLESQR